MATQTVPPLPLPKNWPHKVRSAAVHAIALARLALTTARGRANSADPGSGVVVHRLFSLPRVRSAAVHAIALARLALTTVRGQTGKANVTHLAGRRHLPIVELKKAA